MELAAATGERALDRKVEIDIREESRSRKAQTRCAKRSAVALEHRNQDWWKGWDLGAVVRLVNVDNKSLGHSSEFVRFRND